MIQKCYYNFRSDTYKCAQIVSYATRAWDPDPTECWVRILLRRGIRILFERY
jgi:hypothetical protein